MSVVPGKPRHCWPSTAGRLSRKTLLPYGHQSIDEEDIQAVVETLRSDWLTTGPKVAEFEEAFAARVGREACGEFQFRNGSAACGGFRRWPEGRGRGDHFAVDLRGDGELRALPGSAFRSLRTSRRTP